MTKVFGLRTAFAAALAVLASLAIAGSALAFSADYPVGTCFSTADGLNQCHYGTPIPITYNSGSAPGLQAGVCVYAITGAGSIKGGGRVPCTSSSSFINECFISGTSPSSDPYTYAYVTNKVLVGHTDDS